MAMRVVVDTKGFETTKMAVAVARGRALKIAAEALLEDANRTVPIEEGTLGRSGRVSLSSYHGTEAAVSYDTPYAVRQHEDTRLRHDPGRRAKWLELSLEERGSDLLELIGNEIEGALR